MIDDAILDADASVIGVNVVVVKSATLYMAIRGNTCSCFNVSCACSSTSHIDCRYTHGCLKVQLPVLVSVLLAIMVMVLECSCFCGSLRFQ